MTFVVLEKKGEINLELNIKYWYGNSRLLVSEMKVPQVFLW